MVKVNFRFEYFTQPGQSVVISDGSKVLTTLAYCHPGIWTGSHTSSSAAFAYNYAIAYDGTSYLDHEFGGLRKVDLGSSTEVDLVDRWRSNEDELNTLYTSFFLEGALQPAKTRAPYKKASGKGTLVKFNLRCAQVETGDQVGVMGNCPALGDWDPAKALILSNVNHPLWQGEIYVSGEEKIEYKYFITDANGKLVVLENSFNRCTTFDGSKNVNDVILSDEHFNFERKWRGAGIAIPVFSLRTANSGGVGEFLDIKGLVDWAKITGLKLVQILPINDTVAKHKWMDSYPYAAISVYALHPIYLNLKAMGTLKSKTTQEIIDTKSAELNQLDQVDYEAVMTLKSRFYKLLYDDVKTTFLKDAEYLKWFAKNEEWLLPYAVFSYLRDLYQTPDFSQWKGHEKHSFADLQDIAKGSAFDDIHVHFFIQWHLHLQLTEAAQYARNNKICLKGDIPIGIFRHSVDAWMSPQLFNMEMQSGAPPDDFAVDGQNWGFPTYNWEEMAKDNFSWWVKRLTNMKEYFDAYRIDHVLGFFRIWQVPLTGVTGLMGHFNPAIPLHIQEFRAKGMNFDYDRFCKPYIREHFLWERFGDLTDEAKDKYLNDLGHGIWTLKEHADTQRKVADLLKTTEDMSMAERSKNERMMRCLWSLHSEVLLFEVEGSNGTQFHPRVRMNVNCKSYDELDNYTKEKMYELYLNYFFSRQEDFWAEKAMIKLPAIRHATNMLICAEDLGMVPACVPGVMSKLSMVRLAIQRMPPDTTKDFWHPNDIPYMCVASPSCHDMSTIRGWWEEDKETTQKFWNHILGHTGGAPGFCEPYIVYEVVNQHMHSPCMLSIFPIQDFVGMNEKLRRNPPQSEQINVPANPTHYWRYRFHMNLEDLCKETEFNESVKKMVVDSGRHRSY